MVDLYDDEPNLSDAQLRFLISNIKDYQLTHGSTLKNVQHEEPYTVQSRPIGVSLIPNQFPRPCFEKAWEVQTLFNELYARVASDEQWLEKELGDFLQEDTFAEILWDIDRKARDGSGKIPQPISLGVFRSDYMVHIPGEGHREPELKQVEFNAFSCAGGTHANIVADMHQHLHQIGAYGTMLGDSLQPPKVLPPNNGIRGIVEGLKAAHDAYIETSAASGVQKGVLMIVQPSNTNIADERPLEYALWNNDPPIPCYRLQFGSDAIRNTTLGPNGELLYTSSTCAFSPLEISVVYLRAGYELGEYDDAGYNARLRFEQSRAIKVPSVLGHLTTFKKVQQQLALPGAVEHFLDDEKSAMVRSTFMPMYPLDESEQGRIGTKLATQPETARDYVLKPSLEGGGNNIYGAAIPPFLTPRPASVRRNFILMKMIRSLPQDGTLMSFRGLYKGPVLSELGILGVCLWRAGEKFHILHNDTPGWTFKSKPSDIDEMSVVKGYGFFDSPWLVGVQQGGEVPQKKKKLHRLIEALHRRPET